MGDGFNVDIPDTAFDSPAETPEPVEAPAPEATEAPVETSETAAPEAPAAPVDPKVFTEDYVRELRQESANYRTQAKPFKEVFDGVDESDRDVFLGLVKAYKDDPIAAAKEMARLAQGLLGTDAAAEASATAASTDGYMTEARYNEIREQERLATATRQIESEAKTLGYEIGTPEYQYLLAAAKAHSGDLNAAHAYIEGRSQAAVDRFVASKTAEAQSAPAVPGDQGAPASGERQLKTWRDVEAAIDEMF